MKLIKTGVKVLISKGEFFLLSFLNLLVKKDRKKVYIFDKGLKKDNVWNIAKKLEEDENYIGFKIYYYSGCLPSHPQQFSRVIFLESKAKAFWYRLRSKYVFHSYMEMAKMLPLRGQIIVNTMHGSPLKRIGYMESSSKYRYLNNYNKAFNYILCQSTYFKEVVKESFNAKEEQCIITGYPRNDSIFVSNNTLEKINLEPAIKTVLWVPTWRRDINTGNNNDSTTEFPIMNTENIHDINTYLQNSNVNMIIKPHPFQKKLNIFKESMSNIIILDNEDLEKSGVEFYEMFNDVDALLTDYSSVYFDFLLTGKPIGFTIDDYRSYENKRGFIVDDARTLMPGHLIYTIEELYSFIDDLISNRDIYNEDRIRVNKIANQYTDGRSSSRLLEYIIKEEYDEKK